MFNKPLDEVTLDDIKQLKDDEIPESAAVEYKKDVIRDKKLIKEICGLANANGGYLIFGVEESEEEPPIPKSLPGLSLEDFNMQRTQQVINTNIEPRISVRMQAIEKPSDDTSFVVIHVPEGTDKPYLSTKTGRFYQRYNIETRQMTEPEISNLYKQRFSTPQQVHDYLVELIEYYRERVASSEPIIMGHVFVIPPNIGHRRIGHIDKNTLNKIPNEVIEFKGKYASPLPSTRYYTKFGLAWEDRSTPFTHRLEVHRNGLVHHVDKYGVVYKDEKPFIRENFLAEHALMTLQFASWVYDQINYFGPVTILVLARKTRGVYPIAFLKNQLRWHIENSRSKEIRIEREWPSWQLQNDYVEIVKGIMDEFMNHLGAYEYPFFQEGGYLHSLLPKDS